MEYTQTKQASRVLRVQLPVCDRTVTSEISGEISLPDYQPEIKRLLRVSAGVQPPTRYVGGGSMEFSGTVDYCIYYTGNDGQMYCFPTSQDYTVRLPLEAGADFDLSDALLCYATCEAQSLISRVSGPRRMSIKCRLLTHVKASGCCVIEEKRQVEGNPREERLLGEAHSTVSSYTLCEPFSVSDEIIPDRDDSDGESELRIISGDAQLLLNEAVCASGVVRCQGDLMLKVLLSREGKDALPVTVWRRIGVEHDVPMEGVTPGAQAMARGFCTELSLGVEDGRILCEASLSLEVCARRDETFTYTADLYAIGRESECEWRTYRLPRSIRCLNSNLTQSESLSLGELGLSPDARIADVQGNAQIDELRAEKGRFILSGKCRYSLILLNEGELCAKELELPWRYTLDGAPDEITPLLWEGQACVVKAGARTDAQRLAVDAELALNLCISCERELRTVSAFTVGAPISRAAGEMTLCYPAPDDTLWSVGKRYHAALDGLCERNRLPAAPRADDADSLGECGVIVI